MNEEKKIISRILREPREWFDASEKLPKKGQEVVIRIVDPNSNYGETQDGNLKAAEDMKIGVYMDGKWIVAPPYPRFDYSPFSHGPFLNDGVIVSHWAVPEEAVDENDIGEVDAWKGRFSVAGDYKKLIIDIDPRYEELLYRACSWGAASIREVVGDTKESLPIIGLLWDIQALMDQNAYIKDGEIIKTDKGLTDALDTIDRAKEALKEDGED